MYYIGSKIRIEHIRYYFTLTSYNKGYFFLLCILKYKSKSHVHFRRPEPENLYNQEKWKFPELSEVSGFGRWKLTLDLDSVVQKNPE